MREEGFVCVCVCVCVCCTKEMFEADWDCRRTETRTCMCSSRARNMELSEPLGGAALPCSDEMGEVAKDDVGNEEGAEER